MLAQPDTVIMAPKVAATPDTFLRNERRLSTLFFDNGPPLAHQGKSNNESQATAHHSRLSKMYVVFCNDLTCTTIVAIEFDSSLVSTPCIDALRNIIGPNKRIFSLPDSDAPRRAQQKQGVSGGRRVRGFQVFAARSRRLPYLLEDSMQLPRNIVTWTYVLRGL